MLIGNEQLKAIEAIMAEKGYLDGSRMANVFNMLRPRDLIWPYIVNNYMLGKKPMPFDLLYWNQDSTRMPAANHNFYLSEFYGKNSLAEGKMVLDGVALDMRKVNFRSMNWPPAKTISRLLYPCFAARACSAVRSNSCLPAPVTSQAS